MFSSGPVNFTLHYPDLVNVDMHFVRVSNKAYQRDKIPNAKSAKCVTGNKYAVAQNYCFWRVLLLTLLLHHMRSTYISLRWIVPQPLMSQSMTVCVFFFF